MSVIQRAVDAVLDADPRLSDSTVRKIVQHLVVDGLLPSSGPAGVIDDNAREIANDYMDNLVDPHQDFFTRAQVRSAVRAGASRAFGNTVTENGVQSEDGTIVLCPNWPTACGVASRDGGSTVCRRVVATPWAHEAPF